MNTAGAIAIPIRVEGRQPPPQRPNAAAAPGRQQQREGRPPVGDRLRALEGEMTMEAAGLRLPHDPELTDRLASFLAAQHPDADLQIVVSSVRKTTATKQQFETETPGMVGLPMEQLQQLQRKLMQKISSQEASIAKPDEPEKGREEEEEEWARRGPPDVQRDETVEEGFPVDDGAQMIAKKRTHVVAMSQSRVQGLDDLLASGSAAQQPQPQQHQAPSVPPPAAERDGLLPARSQQQQQWANARAIPVRRV